MIDKYEFETKNYKNLFSCYVTSNFTINVRMLWQLWLVIMQNIHKPKVDRKSQHTEQLNYARWVSIHHTVKTVCTLDTFLWHIGHRTPQTWFNFGSYDDKEFKECWSLDNLFPQWANENHEQYNNYAKPTLNNWIKNE